VASLRATDWLRRCRAADTAMETSHEPRGWSRRSCTTCGWFIRSPFSHALNATGALHQGSSRAIESRKQATGHLVAKLEIARQSRVPAVYTAWLSRVAQPRGKVAP